MDGIEQYVKMHKYGLKCLAIINICGGRVNYGMIYKAAYVNTAAAVMK